MSEVVEGADVPRHRSPPFPFIGLRRALERAREFYERQRQHSAPASVAVTLWGYGVKSSGGIQTIAALKHYGLLEDEGSGADRRVKLSELALKIIRDSRDPSPDRDALIKQAALTPKLFLELWNKFGAVLPAEGTVIYYLQQERGGYTEKSARDLIETYVDTISFARFIEADIDRDVTPSEEESMSPAAQILQPAFHAGSGVKSHVQVRGELIEGERVVFTEEGRPHQYLRLIASGELDDVLLEALEDFVKRQRKRLAANAPRYETPN